MPKQESEELMAELTPVSVTGWLGGMVVFLQSSSMNAKVRRKNKILEELLISILAMVFGSAVLLMYLVFQFLVKGAECRYAVALVKMPA